MFYVGYTIHSPRQTCSRRICELDRTQMEVYLQSAVFRVFAQHGNQMSASLIGFHFLTYLQSR